MPLHYSNRDIELSTYMLPDWHYHHGKPQLSGKLRSHPEDFQVVEQLSFTPNGEGEHVFLRVRKRDSNTQWVAKQLAEFAGIHPKNIGYAGLKDRHALTEQWFSLQILGPEPDWSNCHNDYFSVVEHVRNSRKLKHGALSANQFCITLRDIQGAIEDWQQRIASIKQQGVPNYFGEQRFGHDANNLTQAKMMFQGEIRVKDRHRRGLYLSSARSYLFNEILSRRIVDASWNQAQPGDVMMLNGSHSVFAVEQVTADIEQRITEFDIHPTGSLWGSGDLLSQASIAELEQSVADANEVFRDGLTKAGLKQERRALRIKPDAMTFTITEKDVVCLQFQLPTGSYATSVVRELCRTTF